MTDEPDQVIKVDSATADTCVDYHAAHRDKSYWTAEEKRLKDMLLTQLGIDKNSDRPPESAHVIDSAGELVAQVKVTQRKGLDVKYFRDKYPDIYAECERWTYPIAIRSVD